MPTTASAAVLFGAAILFLTAACANEAGAPNSYPARGPAACSDAFTAENLHPIGGDPAPLAVYEELCDGGLHLLDGASFEPILLINESWRVETLRSLTWSEATQSLVVRADYITGIGPTGVIPFFVELTVQAADGGWQVVDTTKRDEAVVSDDGMVEVHNAEQLASLELVANGEAYVIDVDFEASRLILQSVWLTSGSARISAVDVSRNRQAYFVTYATKAPRLGTTDMKQVVIYAVLPKDYRAVSVGDKELDARAFQAETGVIDRGTFRGAPIP